MDTYGTGTLAGFQRLERLETLAEKASEDMAYVLDASEPIDRFTDDEPTAYDVAWNADAEGMTNPTPCGVCCGPVDTDHDNGDADHSHGDWFHSDCYGEHYWTCRDCQEA